MKRLCLLLALLWQLSASAQIETPGSGAGGGGGSTVTFSNAYYGPFTNLLTYGNSTNFGLQSLATSYTSNALYQPVGLGNASSTIVVNMLGGSMQVVNLTADTSIVVSNATIGANVSILLLGTNNNQFKVIMPTYVRLFSGAITNIVTTNKSMIVSLTSFDSVTNNIVSTISIQP